MAEFFCTDYIDFQMLAHRVGSQWSVTISTSIVKSRLTLEAPAEIQLHHLREGLNGGLTGKVITCYYRVTFL
jgi:hypothetical protein